MPLRRSPQDCSSMEAWDYGTSMCIPLPMPGMSMVMAQGNAFLAQVEQTGPRGRDSLAMPNMFMFDAGQSLGDQQYINVDVMGTFEKWTLPTQGYPELLQIGETNQQGMPFMDAQHPHSSPLMGLTFSDTLALGSGKDILKVFFAPRGESTDGPVAFMHRKTAMVNPDAPLGHHIGQDVGHISSTVLGASLHLRDSTLEASAFHGLEPIPTAVDLPMGPLDSLAFRWIQAWNERFYTMASFASVQNPERDPAQNLKVYRSSASAYTDFSLAEGWDFANSLIYGLINNYDGTASLNSFSEEFLFHKMQNDFWGRLEMLQRTPAELEISTSSPLQPAWVQTLTLGYTRNLHSWDIGQIGVGASVTSYFLPEEFKSTYGSWPWAAKIFLQFQGQNSWE